jgi:SprT protein|tara:strand:+ start:3193 stop:3783 length:591 start_codon:yes stop_codon:yes gene_type:complete
MDKLLKYVPEASRVQLSEYLQKISIEIKVTKQRVTKHGDFSLKKNGMSVITVNNSLNPYQFLITLLHELAHLKVSSQFGYRVKPHGHEWKRAFQETLIPFLRPTVFPDPICSILSRHMKNPKASTNRDFDLVMALKTFDEKKSQTFIYQIENGALFQIYNGKKFIKIKKRRTRFECKEVHTGRIYLFSPHAEVFPL